MQTPGTFQDTFKSRVLRRIGSWGSTLTAQDAERILLWASRIIPNPDIRSHAERLRHAMGTGVTSDVVRSFFELAPLQRRRIMENVLVNWGVIGGSRRYQILDEEGWFPPTFAVVSPTMRCNLRCRGCYAFEYGKDRELTTEEFDGIIRQCKDLGIYFFTISGGEPFVRSDLLDVCGEHDDSFFQVYTNGTLIDDRLADRLSSLGNVAPAISVEGYGGETDNRRGAGTFDAVMAAMGRLRERSLLFGISVTVTKQNHDIVKSDEFIDHYIAKGAKFAWLFQYIPIGRRPDVGLMSTPEQRVELGTRVAELRRTRPIFIGDFWNDGHYIGGCMAGGRVYFHVTSNGNVEPCVFCHFAVGNVREKPLREILTCDLFRAIRYEQPYSDIKNVYAPCMIIDNPAVLRRLVREFGARPSHEGAETVVEDPAIVAHLDRYAARMHEITDRRWLREHYDNPASEWYRGGVRAGRQWSLERAQLEAWARKTRGARKRAPVEQHAGVRG
jgi:MoaA/NifB/PqqE/SkfB family radical SAM enzyme